MDKRVCPESGCYLGLKQLLYHKNTRIIGVKTRFLFFMKLQCIFSIHFLFQSTVREEQAQTTLQTGGKSKFWAYLVTLAITHKLQYK